MTNLPAGLSLNDRIDRIEHEHPEIMFSAPWATESGRWEVSEPNRAAVAYENGFAMIGVLEAKYPPKPED